MVRPSRVGSGQRERRPRTRNTVEKASLFCRRRDRVRCVTRRLAVTPKLISALDTAHAWTAPQSREPSVRETLRLHDDRYGMLCS